MEIQPHWILAFLFVIGAIILLVLGLLGYLTPKSKNDTSKNNDDEQDWKEVIGVYTLWKDGERFARFPFDLSTEKMKQNGIPINKISISKEDDKLVAILNNEEKYTYTSQPMISVQNAQFEGRFTNGSKRFDIIKYGDVVRYEADILGNDEASRVSYVMFPAYFYKGVSSNNVEVNLTGIANEYLSVVRDYNGTPYTVSGNYPNHPMNEIIIYEDLNDNKMKLEVMEPTSKIYEITGIREFMPNRIEMNVLLEAGLTGRIHMTKGSDARVGKYTSEGEVEIINNPEQTIIAPDGTEITLPGTTQEKLIPDTYSDGSKKTYNPSLYIVIGSDQFALMKSEFVMMITKDYEESGAISQGTISVRIN